MQCFNFKDTEGDTMMADTNNMSKLLVDLVFTKENIQNLFGKQNF